MTNKENNATITVRNVQIYASPTCAELGKIKALLDERHVKYREIIVESGDVLATWLAIGTGRHELPQVFVDGELIGGYRELAALDANRELSSS